MNTAITKNDIRIIIREIDANGNGKIEYHEFCFLMLYMTQQENRFNYKMSVLSNNNKNNRFHDSISKVDIASFNHSINNNSVSAKKVDENLHTDQMLSVERGERDDNEAVFHSPDTGRHDDSLVSSNSTISTNSQHQDEVMMIMHLHVENSKNTTEFVKNNQKETNKSLENHPITETSSSISLIRSCCESVDLILDLIVCNKKQGPHGRLCMCGCRKIVMEEVVYPILCTKSRDEPLTWQLVCSFYLCSTICTT
jgi:hypothetical protein